MHGHVVAEGLGIYFEEFLMRAGLVFISQVPAVRLLLQYTDFMMQPHIQLQWPGGIVPIFQDLCARGMKVRFERLFFKTLAAAIPEMPAPSTATRSPL